MEDEEANPSAATPCLAVNQLQRYYTVLRDFMAHFHSRAEIYPPNHEFNQQELSGIGPQDITTWMNLKLYNKEDPKEEERPLNGSHHTLDYYKKSISYFMPEKEATWNPASKKGNPTKSREVNDLISKVKEFDTEDGGSKKRKLLATGGALVQKRCSKPTAKMAKTLLPLSTEAEQLASLSRDGATMQRMLRTMHAQNASFIDLFGTLSRSLEQFKTTLSCNNMAIMNEIMNLNSNAVSNQVLPPGSGKVGEGGDKKQPSKIAAEATTEVDAGMLDWQYVHSDGVRRRVPPTWTFPHCNLHDMYISWHCGDYQNRISPMKYFQNSDVCFLSKRAKMNLNEVRNLTRVVDDEATRKGKILKSVMTSDEAVACFQAGLSGFRFSANTPTGKTRDIMRLKWSTLTKYNKKKALTLKAEAEEAEAEIGEEKARQEFVSPSLDDDETHDNWWYKHDDEVKRRVPSTWKFPMVGLEDIYVYWHCGDAEQKISPMKLFQTSDLLHIKRGNTNLSEVRSVVTLVDSAATKRGMTVNTVMTPEEAKECCNIGYPSLNISDTTPDGRAREVLRMKWSSAVRLKHSTDDGAPEAGNDVPEAEEAELSEIEF